MAKYTPRSLREALAQPVGRRRLLRGGAQTGVGAALGMLAVPGSRAAVAAPHRQDAEVGLRVFSTNPLNAGTPLELLEGLLTPNRLFFIRDHYAVPQLARESWSLTVTGAVERPLTLSFDELRRLPSRSQTTLIECAGNGRAGFDPPAEGTQWDNSAVSTAEWTGVSLATVLERAGLRPDAVEVVFQGGDNPTFQRSLTREHALETDVLLAYAMNGEPLPAAHGFPLRLVVPGWVGVASVKWLTRIEAVTRPFEGFYQRQRYVIERPDQPTVPATWLPVKAVIARPIANAILAPGPQLVSGFAWSGQGRIRAVEVSADGGERWQLAYLADPQERWSWTRWELAWDPDPGSYTLLARATDETGSVQPAEVAWNRLGYGYNALWPVRVEVVRVPPSPPLELPGT